MKKLGTKARFYYLLQWRTLEFSLSFSSLRRGWILIFWIVEKRIQEEGERRNFVFLKKLQPPRVPGNLEIHPK
jgi:hypothetical protein